MKYPCEESATIEFKRELPKNDQIIKTVVGFCNQKGGEIILGVDNDGTIVGVPEDKVSQLLEYLDKSIYDATAPAIVPRIFSQRMGDKLIVIIRVSEGMNKPYYIKVDGVKKGTYIRLGRTTSLAKSETIEELKWQSRPRSLSYDSMPVYDATLDDLDLEKFRDFLTLRKHAPKGPMDVQELLRSSFLVTDERGYRYPTVAGILLFGRDPQRFLPEAYIICSEYSGTSGRKVLSTITCTGSLFEQYFKAYKFLTDRLPYSFTIEGPRRKEVLEIPEVAIREAIVNAIIHRNYHISAPAKVSLYDNRIEIFSPGDFPGQLTQDILRCGISYIRNYAITKVFHEIGYIEKLGSGLNAIFESYEERGLEEPSVVEGPNFVKCILPRPSARGKAASESESIDEDLQRIIRLFKTSGELSISDVIEHVRINRATAGRKIAALVENGLLKKIGKGKGTRYVLR